MENLDKKIFAITALKKLMDGLDLVSLNATVEGIGIDYEGEKIVLNYVYLPVITNKQIGDYHIPIVDIDGRSLDLAIEHLSYYDICKILNAVEYYYLGIGEKQTWVEFLEKLAKMKEKMGLN